MYEIQMLGIYTFLVLLAVAVAIFVYIGFCELLEKLRAGGKDDELELHAGPFNLRGESSLQRHFARRHKVQVRDRWYCSGKWVPRE